MTSTPEDLATASRELALAALHEITAPATVGPAAGHSVEEDGAVSLRFENRLPGYPGWYWTVTVAQVDDAEPTVLEVELLPGDGALLAPDWVPWAERLAEYRAHQAELAEQAAAEGSEEDEADEDLDEDDADADPDDDDLDSDDDVSDLLHAGDLDGVDIDELDEPSDDEEATESSDEDSSDEEE
ncbi:MULTISPECIES: DUF3027 domain-containing protein [unclassified Microbacterium]|uniref:DUF3027 domain-containing protein n=1 Tax=unclassified Microbacterium TaxID=2609290 RepID=UPI0012FB15FD|nr:DUF3027 domain-containing protein [Microbacterium sp. MAH-37]MVQ40981.1 DUF3027 domain-containing protein [Microbacterium sp. MAH-37]